MLAVNMRWRCEPTKEEKEGVTNYSSVNWSSEKDKENPPIKAKSSTYKAIKIIKSGKIICNLGVTKVKAKYPYTTVGIPASISRNGFAILRTRSGAYSERKTAVAKPIGTAKRLQELKTYTVAAKSGTVELVSTDTKEDYKIIRENEGNRDHAIIIAFGPMPNPKYAVSVVIENGESGGSVAGPVAIAVLNSLVGK